MKSGPRNRLQLAAVNKASKVKQLKTINKQSNNRNMAGARNNSREIKNHVVDARFKLVQKSLEKLIDARQKLTKQRDAREIIQGRHLQYHNVSKQSVFFNVIEYSFKTKKLFMDYL